METGFKICKTKSSLILDLLIINSAFKPETNGKNT